MTMPDSRQSDVLYANYVTHTKPHSVTYNDGLRFYLFRLQAEGTCRARVAGNDEIVIPGDLLLYSPDQPYELNVSPRSAPDTGAVQPVGDYYLIARGEWLDSWWRTKSLPAKTNIGFDDTVMTLWKRIIHEKQKVMQNQAELLDYLLRALCLTLEQVVPGQRRTRQADTAHKLKLYIENHAHEPLRLENIAASVGLSVSRCSYLFKAAFGQSMFAYCVDVRMKLAQQQVLYSNLALERVADRTGFPSYPHFCRAFRERFGHPPGEYRRRFGFPFKQD